MNILGLYDEKNPETEGAVAALEAWARSEGHAPRFVDASALSLKPCLGCFGCWLQTPGSCLIGGDEGRAFVEALAPADLFLVLTRIPFGSFAPAVKRTLDRSIPVLLPYFTLHRGEMHHAQRYRRPRRLLHVPYGDYEAEELATFAGLAAAHCDNLLAPPARRQFAYRGDPEALVAWVAEELAS
ncbi:MAG TPA: hypothetical protein PLB91_16005 [Spirochaetales bacterium]|nr:hypothetical protein [Spirochaetales bacterium]HRY53800.1 hypothetical protein [Spirochaetia bacterium]HRZ64639.1 hypothetical protein [Spirochaetia bacterium]